jgi:hypothetical protein
MAGKDIHIYQLCDLLDMTESGDEIRSCCPVHHGDNPSALQIDTAGEDAGFGYCHRCGAVVLIEELNPDAAARIRRLQRGEPPQRLARPPRRDFRSPARSREPSQAQVFEHAMLSGLFQRMQAALAYSANWAQVYLCERGIPVSLALQEGLGYFSRNLYREVQSNPVTAPHARLLAPWVNCIVFPLVKRRPVDEGAEPGYMPGFIGRQLSFWKPGSGIDEDEQKRLLDAHNEEVLAYNRSIKSGEVAGRYRHQIRRWYKTEPAGWFYVPSRLGEIAVLVEGGFDKLALLAAHELCAAAGVGTTFSPGSLIALAGTAARASLLEPGLRTVILGLDGDNAGWERMICLREDLLHACRHPGQRVYLFPPPQDAFGKDWSARWRRGGLAGVAPLFAAYDYAQSWTCEPLPEESCLILVEEISDALAVIEAARTLGRPLPPGRVLVLGGADWTDPLAQLAAAHSVVFSVGDTCPSDAGEGATAGRVCKIRKDQRERLVCLHDDLLRAGIRVRDCPAPSDGRGSAWAARLAEAGPAALRLLLDTYDDLNAGCSLPR